MAVTLIVNIKRFLGVSGDVKPTDVPAGSLFYETDTSDNYVFDGSSWVIRRDTCDS